MTDSMDSSDIKLGDAIPEWVMPSVLRERMRTMAAILRDPNQVHWDPSSVERLGFGNRTINQGPLGLSYMINMLHVWQGPTSIRRVYVTFPQAVLDGERAIAQGEVSALREDNGERIATCRIWLDVGEPGVALEGTAEVVISE